MIAVRLLTALQDKLERQQNSNEMERARLQGLIAQLELQLTEQTRHLEQVRDLVYRLAFELIT
jgi:hypothetical protein